METTGCLFAKILPFLSPSGRAIRVKSLRYGVFVPVNTKGNYMYI